MLRVVRTSSGLMGQFIKVATVSPHGELVHRLGGRDLAYVRYRP